MKIYGIAASRAIRPLWAAEELGLEYEHVKWHYAGQEVKSDAYLALNPNGTVPALVDGSVVMFESMAMTIYLAQTYGQGSLWPKSKTEQAHVLQWTLWAATEVEPLARQWFHHTSFLAPELRKPEMVDAALQSIRSRLGVLESWLGKCAYLAGDAFTVADLNVAAVLQRLAALGGDAYPGTTDWHQRCTNRTAAKKAFALRNAG